MRPEPTGLESDPRFPSGPWTGYFLQKAVPGRHLMDLHLTFQNGDMTGEGRDLVGEFIVRGRYTLADGRCHWTKRYVGKHDVFYQGFNEGKGIWGTWQIPTETISGFAHGGFHIWPVGMPDPSQDHLKEAKELPRTEDEEPPAPESGRDSKELELEPVGA